MGLVLGVHGIKGAVRILSYAAEPEDIASYGPLEDESGGRKFSLTVVGKARGAVLAEVEGIGDRDAATALKGTKLYVRRSALPTPAEGEFYWDDLVGLRAELKDGTALGEVTAVHDYGGGPSLEVKREAGASVMVPFTNRVVPVVDLEAGRLVIDPPEGLLDNRPIEAEKDE
ncbi:MAG TPA: ribosome maturation factor RimM [Stellaceae bacterium]|nr:ribosome maturation factor RimM [Stellaceae bacterium]